MNRKHLNIFLLFTITVVGINALNAQKLNKDSLYAIWADTSLSELTRLDVYYSRFKDMDNENNPEEASRWVKDAELAIELATKHDKTEYLGLFHFLSGAYYYFVLNQPELACPRLTAALNVTRNKYDQANYRISATAISILFDSKCPGFGLNEVLAMFSDLEAKVSFKDPIDRMSMGGMYLRLGFSLEQNSRYPEALQVLQKSRQYTKDVASEESTFIYASASEQVGKIHLETGNYKESIRYLDESLKLNKRIKDTMRMGSSYIGLARVSIKSKHIDKAKGYLDTAMYIMNNIEKCEPCMRLAQRVKAGLDNLMGNHLAALSQLEELSDYYSDANNMLPGPELNRERALFYAELGTTYLGLQKYEKAIAAANKGIERADRNLYESLDNYGVLYQAWEALGNHQKALDNFRKHISVRDSMTTLRNSQEVTRLELENQYEQQRLTDSLNTAQQQLKTELAFQEELSRQKTNRNIGMGLGLIALLLAIGLFSRLRFIRKTQAALKEKNSLIEAEKEKAKASEKAKHQFLANMSHEIRTPMNAIKGMTDILLRREPKQEQMEYLQGIKQSSNSLLVIINDILDLSKIEAGRIELEQVPFSIKEVLKEVQTIMQFKAEEKGLELKMSIPEGISKIKGDPSRLRQVLLNLVGNAIKFTEKGMVTIKVSEEELPGRPTELKFTVSDTGVGIDTDRLDKIFESFEQAYTDTSRKFGGTGLGLSISKKLVDLHGGQIWADSQKGVGSQFHFTIPYKKTTTTAPKPTVETISLSNGPAAGLKGIRVLLVEDNDFNALVAREELEDAIEEAQITVAENGAIAVEKIKMDTYDVILMDVQMPTMNGYEATEKIRSLENGKSDIPIIAMTANVLKDEVDRCFEAGMDDFIGKPFDTDDLLNKINQLILKHEV